MLSMKKSRWRFSRAITALIARTLVVLPIWLFAPTAPGTDATARSTQSSICSCFHPGVRNQPPGRDRRTRIGRWMIDSPPAAITFADARALPRENGKTA